MPTGTVMTWCTRGSYGFATTADGETVFLHQSHFVKFDEAQGGDRTQDRLQVGASVNFDIKTVAGHDGRVKGINISGPGVVTGDQWKENLESGGFMHETQAAAKAWKEYKGALPPCPRCGERHTAFQCPEKAGCSAAVTAALRPVASQRAPDPRPAPPPPSAGPPPSPSPASSPAPAGSCDGAAEVSSFLADHGLSQFLGALVRDGYDDMATLREVDDDELRAMGMQPMDVVCLRAGLAAAAAPPSSPAAPPPRSGAAEVSAFLDTNGLSQFREALLQDGYEDMDTLREVSDQELAAMGMEPACIRDFRAGLTQCSWRQTRGRRGGRGRLAAGAQDAAPPALPPAAPHTAAPRALPEWRRGPRLEPGDAAAPIAAAPAPAPQQWSLPLPPAGWPAGPVAPPHAMFAAAAHPAPTPFTHMPVYGGVAPGSPPPFWFHPSNAAAPPAPQLPAPQLAAPPPQVAPVAGRTLAAEIQQLHELLQRGILTEPEFGNAKAAVIASAVGVPHATG